MGGRMHMRMQSCTCDMDTDGTRTTTMELMDMPRGFRRNGPGGPWLASRSPAQGSHCSSRASGTHCSWRLRSRRTQRAHSRTGGGRVVSGCVRLAPRGHVAVCVARAAWLSPRGPSRSSPRASGSLCSSRLRCHAAASGRAAARLHVRTVKSSAERCSVSPNSPAARANSRSRPARRAASRISRRARVASGLSAFWMMEGRHARLSSEHEADGTSGEDPARRGARKQSELFIGTKLQHFSAVSSASPLGGLSTCCC